MSRRDDATRPLAEELAAAVPLALYSAAVAAGFARVFAGWQFFDNLLVLVVVGHGLSLLLRRFRVPGLVALPVVAVVLCWAIGAMHYRFTYSALLPTSETWNLFTSELELVRGQFRTAVAPVIYGAGWDVLASIGVAAVVLLADAFAFRAYARAEALVPGGVLFVFVAALGDNRDRVALSVVLVGTGVLATAMLRAYHAHRSSVIGGRFSGTRLAAPAAAFAAATIALGAGFVGPRIPGAHAEPIYDATAGGGGASEVLNPLVDIRTRLTNRSDAEMFVVRANVPSYWRSAALAEFDGTLWGIPERPVESLPSDPVPGGDDVQIEQRVSITALEGSLIPAAPDPTALSSSNIDVEWIPEDATLVATDHELAPGDTFDIVSTSTVHRLDSTVLSSATSNDPGDPLYVELPPDYPDLARELAAEVTAGATTPYQTALMLQDWFRDPDEFSYSLEVQKGHANNYIESFLNERVGYCEQFAGTYASMLRALGIPARVAVGFTQGREEAPGTYSVRGRNAHAWPEVWFDDIGWVLFEPTPGRGAPGTVAYTRHPAEQDESEPAAEDDAAAAEQTGPTTTFAPTDASTPLNIPPEEVFGGAADGAFTPEPAEPTSSSPRLAIAIAFVVLALAAVAPAISRWFARRRGGSAEAQLARHWRRAVRSLSDVGVEHHPSDTPLESAATTAELFPIAARPTRSLAEAVTTAMYRPDGTRQLEVNTTYGHSGIRDCANWSRQIDRAVNDSVSPVRRVVRYFTRWT